jgi:hypothetical protein
MYHGFRRELREASCFSRCEDNFSKKLSEGSSESGDNTDINALFQ